MAINIIPVEKPTCWPITGNIGDFPLAGTTPAKLILSRFPVAVAREIEVRADFIPSAALAARLCGGIAAQVVADDGTILAESGDHSGEHLVLNPDTDSRFLQYPWDLLALNEELVGQLSENRIFGCVREGAVIDGKIQLGENSVILPGVYIEGNVIIGNNCKIGPNCYIRGNTSVGDRCHIGQAVEIKNSILGHHVSIGHLSYAGDSVICSDVNFGAGTIVSNLRHDNANHRYEIAGQLVETGRRKFGAVIGAGVHTGIHSAIFPGRSLSPMATTRPGEVVDHAK